MKARELKVLPGVCVAVFPNRVNRYAILDLGLMTWVNSRSEVREYFKFRESCIVARKFMQQA